MQSADAPVRPEEAARPLLIMLCTGNAARSVMAGAMLDAAEALARVTTAGTHVVEHQPMSIRTRTALAAVGLDASHHRSRQLTDADISDADLVVAMAAEHVRFVRRRHPEGASRTATIAWLAEHLPPGPAPLADRVAALALDTVDPDEQGDVADPAGGTDEDYARCATQLRVLVRELQDRL
ncbi:MAG: arsenate reductase/protein-tyrosine-phosphatase family protein [Acidimicrobiales bacterium]